MKTELQTSPHDLMRRLIDLTPEDLAAAFDTITEPQPAWWRHTARRDWQSFLAMYFFEVREFVRHVKSGCPGCEYEFISVRELRKQNGKSAWITREVYRLPHGALKSDRK